MGSGGSTAKGGAQAKGQEGEDKDNVNDQVNAGGGSGDNGTGKHKSPNVKKTARLARLNCRSRKTVYSSKQRPRFQKKR